MLQSLKIKLCMVCKRILDKFGKIDASEQAAAARRKRLLCAGIYTGIGEFLCITQQVPPLDPVPEQSSRFCIVPVRLSNPAEQIPGIYFLFDNLSVASLV